MVGILAHVASYIGDFHHGGMCAGAEPTEVAASKANVMTIIITRQMVKMSQPQSIRSD